MAGEICRLESLPTGNQITRSTRFVDCLFTVHQVAGQTRLAAAPSRASLGVLYEPRAPSTGSLDRRDCCQTCRGGAVRSVARYWSPKPGNRILATDRSAGTD